MDAIKGNLTPKFSPAIRRDSKRKMFMCFITPDMTINSLLELIPEFRFALVNRLGNISPMLFIALV